MRAPMSLIEEIRLRRLPPPEQRRRLRLALGVSQIRAAKELGCSRVTFARIEAGRQQPKDALRYEYIDLLARLAQELRTQESGSAQEQAS